MGFCKTGVKQKSICFITVKKTSVQQLRDINSCGFTGGMVLDSSVSDGGWGASCYQAMVGAAKESSWETVYTDNVATADFATVMTDYAELGYNLIFAPGNQYTDAVKQVAAEYPEIKFALLNGTVETDNITSILPDAKQIGYMAGALAGLMSKTGSIGFIGGMIVCRNLEQAGYNVVNIANGIAYYRGKYMVRG